MNIFTRITGKTMKKNPVRTLVTIIGIVIATAMFTAVTSFATSLWSFVYKTEAYQAGAYHVSIEEADYSLMQELNKDSKIDRVATAETIGYAYAGSSNEYKPYVYIIGVDNEFLDMLPIHITSGRVPERENEIIIPDHLYKNGNVYLELGETVTYDVGKRYVKGEYGENNEDYSLGQYNPFNDEVEEEIVVDETVTYTIVGFYERPDFENYTAPGYTLITYKNGDFNSEAVFDLYVTMKDVKGELYHIEEKYDTNVQYNWNVLRYLGVTKYDNISDMLVIIVVIFILIIMTASVTMIYSAFSISVSERTKQFGLLSSLGATKRQIIRTVFAEAFIVAGIGIPIGIVCGLTGIGITLYFIGDKFSELSSSPYSLRLVINYMAIVSAAVISLVTVTISAIIPSVRATRVTAIEAIRQVNDIKSPKWKRRNKKYRLTNMLFGLEGVLGAKYFSRSKRKYRITIFSLFISIVLFISTNAYCTYLKGLFIDNFKVPGYDMSYTVYSNPSEYEEVLKEANGLEELIYCSAKGYNLDYTEEETTQNYKDYIKKLREVYNYSDEDVIYECVNIFFVNDEFYLKCMNEAGLDGSEYTDISKAPGLFYNRGKNVIYHTNEKGENLRYTYEYDLFKEEKEKLYIRQFQDGEEREKIIDISVAAYIEKLPDILPETSNCALIMPYSSVYKTDDLAISFMAKATDRELLMESAKKLLKDNNYAMDNLYDPYESQQTDRNFLTIINVFSYGFITLMTMICIANVFNTISTNIALRRRDFAMFRSVGLDEKGIHRMLFYECLLYGVRSLIIAVPVSIIFSYFIWDAYSYSGELEFYLPIGAIIIAIIGVFGVVAISMVYAVSKMRKDNPIDALKSDNV